jgi:SAM-dependent methyltransferase
VSYADVSRHPALNGSEFRFDVISEENPGITYENHFFDHVMAGCVGHHTQCPEVFLANLSRITRKDGKVVLIESVFGVHHPSLSPSSPGKSSRSEKLLRAEALFKGLSKESQLGWLVFFDYFYNRVIHYTEDKDRKIPMGLSYGTPESWIEEAGKAGLEHVSTCHYGVDRNLVPVYHLCHVFKGSGNE